MRVFSPEFLHCAPRTDGVSGGIAGLGYVVPLYEPFDFFDSAKEKLKL